MSSAAPGRLETVRAFINTRDVEDGTDALDSPAALTAWLAEHGLGPADANVDEDGWRRTLAFREALRALATANHGEVVDPEPVDRLNAVMAAAPLVLAADADGELSLAPAAKGIDGALAQLAAIVYDAAVEGSWQRLKACPADDCRWAFYDRSRNRSRTWCSMEVCGNRAKVRAFRERSAP